MSYIKSRQYQQDIENTVFDSWRKVDNICVVSPTGSGKTVIVSNIIKRANVNTVVIAHRQELVSQMSLALARNGVQHKIIAPKSVVSHIVSAHVIELGRSFYNPRSTTAIAGVDTLVRRTGKMGGWEETIQLWVIDECHHLLVSNKWGKAARMFSNAKGLGVTANTIRADGKGIGRDYDGVFDYIVQGPHMRDLIDQGYLCDYKIYSPPSDIDLSQIKISATTGDYNHQQLKKVAEKSHIVGDIVEHYLKLARGKLGVTFATDVVTAKRITDEYNAAGVRAELITAKTPDNVRLDIQRRFRNKDIIQLVNVDLFGEGYDLPAIEVVTMGRPTQSYNLFCQQFGRALRPMEGKDTAIIIDHVNNCINLGAVYGLPDAPRKWPLESQEKKGRSKTAPNPLPMKTCSDCSALYLRVLHKCPYCGSIWVPDNRSSPKFVDGDLTELDPRVIEKLRGDIAKIDCNPDIVRDNMINSGASLVRAGSVAKSLRIKQEAQKILRDHIAMWAAHQRLLGVPDKISYKIFYFKFDTDVLTAQTLNTSEARSLTEQIQDDIETII